MGPLQEDRSGRLKVHSVASICYSPGIFLLIYQEGQEQCSYITTPETTPFAWSFHYLHLVPRPARMPPSSDDLAELRRLARLVASAFHSRLVVADFARAVDGRWWFIEAGPGSCAGTGHEQVFKAVVRQLQEDMVGGPL